MVLVIRHDLFDQQKWWMSVHFTKFVIPKRLLFLVINNRIIKKRSDLPTDLFDNPTRVLNRHNVSLAKTLKYEQEIILF
jgi:hypothetical protein